MDKEKYKQLQIEMASKVEIPKEIEFKMENHSLIFTFDIQYEGNVGYVAVDIQSFGGELKDIFTYKYEVKVAYQPGYFAFREGPLLKQALEDVIKNEGYHPSLLIIDGHGTAHPRKLGVASWLGVETGIPSMGIAKEPLLKTNYNHLAQKADSIVEVRLEDELVGFVLRSQTGIKPIFVSAGHLISQEEALNVAKKFKGQYRIFEPIRRADQAARKVAKLA